jgi:hypothetical protein
MILNVKHQQKLREKKVKQLSNISFLKNALSFVVKDFAEKGAPPNTLEIVCQCLMIIMP